MSADQIAERPPSWHSEDGGFPADLAELLARDATEYRLEQEIVEQKPGLWLAAPGEAIHAGAPLTE